MRRTRYMRRTCWSQVGCCAPKKSARPLFGAATSFGPLSPSEDTVRHMSYKHTASTILLFHPVPLHLRRASTERDYSEAFVPITAHCRRRQPSRRAWPSSPPSRRASRRPPCPCSALSRAAGARHPRRPSCADSRCSTGRMQSTGRHMAVDRGGRTVGELRPR